MTWFLIVVGYIGVALIVEYVAARVFWPDGLGGTGILWPVSVPFGLLFALLTAVGERARRDRWNRP